MPATIEYEFVYEGRGVNEDTGEPWKVEEIQGQTMEFAVNGAE